MPISPFRLKSTIGRNYKVDLNDRRRTKEALQRLGYFETPSYGLTDYPDDALFNAIENFQSENDLRRDGVMRPGGETEKALGSELVDLDEAQTGSPNESNDSQVAQAGPFPAAAIPLLMGTPLVAGAGHYLAKQAERLWNRTDNDFEYPANENNRSSIVEPLPPVPPSEPDNEEKGYREEFPASPPLIPELNGRPINEVIKNDPVIFEIVRDEVVREFTKPVESHRGNPTTQEGNTITANDILPKVIALWGAAKAELYRHIGGARDKDGNPIPEKYLPNILTGGRKESSNADITIEVDDETHHFNTGRTLKDGVTGIADERRSFANLGRNAGSDLAGFLPKLRPGMDRQEWYDRTYKMAVEYFTKHWGPPPQ